ncbi:MAG TPA: DNA internalization-related competence protein ComEC/Rec2, partial [Trueperaceae bacterium]|nr:DNA internalization-related competence protein ComEC/Rec2 [Trueperaceae bacterium]
MSRSASAIAPPYRPADEPTRQQRERGMFVPWPFPVAVGAGLGIWAADWLGGAAAVATCVAVVGAAVLLAVALHSKWWRARRLAPCGQTGGSSPGPGHVGTPPTLLPRLPAAFLPLVMFAAVAGAFRLDLYTAGTRGQAALLGEWLGQVAIWDGYYDGVTFMAERPVRVRLSPVALDPLPQGRLSLSATAESAPGKRNPGGFDYRGHLLRRGIAGQLFVAEVVSSAPQITVRERLRRGVAAGLPPDVAALMVAMTLGLRGDLGALRDSFTQSGLAHLLSLSGLHFGVLLAAASRLTLRLGPARVYVLMFLTIGFVALVGTAPTVLRAASMAMAALIGLATGVGKFEPWTVLALSLVLGLLAAPQMLFDISLQLSYLALAGLLLFLGPVATLLRLRVTASAERGFRPRAWLRTTVVVGCVMSVVAQLPSLSLVAGTFGSVALVGPLLNVVAVPLAALAVPLGFAAGLLGLVAEPLAWLLNRLTLIVVTPITWLAEAGAEAPALAWAEVGWLGHLCWATFVAALALWVRGRLRPRRLLLVGLVGGGVCLAAGPQLAPPDVWFLDVGQGDSILIRLPGRYEVLIDGGGSPFSDDDVGRRVVIPALRALGVDELELVVASHPDADHVEGLLSVLEEIPVGVLLTGPVWPDVVLDQRLRAVARGRGIEVREARRGETVVLGGPRQDAIFEVLHPPPVVSGSSSNEASLVLLLRYRGQAVALFTGDAGAPTEERLAVPHVELLQAGHHGSRFSTGEALLLATSPRVAVVSVGDNNYGHPHPDVLRRLAEHS